MFLFQYWRSKKMFMLPETSIPGDAYNWNCFSYGAYFCNHVCCTFDMVPLQLLKYQFRSPPYAQRRRENVNNLSKLFF